MPDDFELRRMKDGRVLVVLHAACAITKEAILELLAELSIDESAVVFLLPEEVGNCDALSDAPVVIPIDQAISDAPELDAAGRYCAQAGGRVVILFGDTFPYKGLHPIADKFGTQCGWSADQLAGCIKSLDLAPPLSSSGTLVAWTKSEQVKC